MTTPRYCALMAWPVGKLVPIPVSPSASVASVVSVASPFASRLTGLPTGVPSKLNCTCPVGVPEPGVAAATVAVNLTGCR